jgi:hypothetical protein
MFRHVALSFALFVAASAPSFAQNMQGTAEEEAACRPDVRKLCRQAMAGSDSGSQAIAACLQANRLQLSQPCSQVFESHGR